MLTIWDTVMTPKSHSMVLSTTDSGLFLKTNSWQLCECQKCGKDADESHQPVRFYSEGNLVCVASSHIRDKWLLFYA